MNTDTGRSLNIALLSPYLPGKYSGAGPRKIYTFIKTLSARGHKVFLFSFCSREDKERIHFIRQYCADMYVEYLENYFYYPQPALKITRKIRDLCNTGIVDIVQCESSYLTRYLPKDGLYPHVLVEHEVLSVSLKEKARCERQILEKYILFVRALKKWHEEKRWYARYDTIIAFSAFDKFIIQRRNSSAGIAIIPLAIDLNDYMQPVKQEAKLYDVLFVGNYSHSPNVDAVLYFYHFILPLIREKVPHVKVTFAGMSPPAKIMKIARYDKNIEVTGYAEHLADAYATAKVAIAPLRHGTGMRYKILEAMLSGVPVVATSIGARGIEEDVYLRIADTCQSFANEVIFLLLMRPELYGNISKSAKLAVIRNYDPDVIAQQYERVYFNLLDKKNSKKGGIHF